MGFIHWPNLVEFRYWLLILISISIVEHPLVLFLNAFCYFLCSLKRKGDWRQLWLKNISPPNRHFALLCHLKTNDFSRCIVIFFFDRTTRKEWDSWLPWGNLEHSSIWNMLAFCLRTRNMKSYRFSIVKWLLFIFGMRCFFIVVVRPTK